MKFGRKSCQSRNIAQKFTHFLPLLTPCARHVVHTTYTHTYSNLPPREKVVFLEKHDVFEGSLRFSEVEEATPTTMINMADATAY